MKPQDLTPLHMHILGSLYWSDSITKPDAGESGSAIRRAIAELSGAGMIEADGTFHWWQLTNDGLQAWREACAIARGDRATDD